MIKIKCSAKDCKNLKDNTCSLENINIDFNYGSEGYGAFCSNFTESDECRRRTYRLHKLKEGLYFAIRTSVFEDIDIEMILGEIEGDNAIIIGDNLLYYGSAQASNRFWIYGIGKGEGSLNKLLGKSELVEYLEENEIGAKDVLKLTCDYIRKTGNNGCLISTTYKMIMKGIDL